MLQIIKERLIQWLISLNLRKNEIQQIVLVILVSVILAIILLLTDNQALDITVWRNTYGEGSNQQKYQVSIPGMLQDEDVIVDIQEQIYTEEKLEEALNQAWQMCINKIKEDHGSLEEVSNQLELPKSLADYPFGITWNKTPAIIFDGQGFIQEEHLEEEGNVVQLQGIFDYMGGTTIFTQAIKVVAVEKSKQQMLLTQLVESIDEISEESKYQESYMLPQHLDGLDLRWGREKSYRGFTLILLGLVIAILLLFKKKEEMVQAEKLKLQQMEQDYPEIINTFVLYMGAGMTSKNAWKKVVEVYLQKGVVREGYAQMQATYQEMENGRSEVEAYERFSNRCTLGPYKKFGLLLSQNVIKGTKGLKQILESEARMAFEARKRRAKSLGEAAGTKLLMPMFLMLAVVLVIIVVPAFMSIQL